MTYILYNHTNYGDGVYIIGTLRSKKRALKIIKELKISEGEGDMYTFNPIESLDQYTDESIINYAKKG